MIDVRAARNDPERFRAALARRGAAEAFDALLAADARWRELVPQVDELRAQQKLQGKPTPEQLEELKARKTRLNELEAELAAAEAERDAALVKVPNPPHESAADGTTEDDAVEITRWGERRNSPIPRSTPRSAASSSSARQRSPERASASSSETRRSSRSRSTGSHSTGSCAKALRR
jgi:seryl-tRNA synthetase